MQFLKSLEDEIVTERLWLEMKIDMLDREKEKKNNISDEDERMQTLARLSTAPAHNASFTLIILMLARVANEITPLDLLPTEHAKAESVPDQAGARNKRSEIDVAYAGIFADAMIRLPTSLKGKELKASEARRKQVVEVFIRPRLNDGS